MKKLILTIAVLALTSTSVLAETVKVSVNGMVCSFCAAGLEKSFKKLGDVNKVGVDLDNKLVTIDTAEGKTISDEVIKKTITDAGFEVVEIKR